MPHLDDELIALIALGERVDDSANTHLRSCETCEREVSSYARAVRAGRASIDAQELYTPARRVWSRVVDELGLSLDVAGTGNAPLVDALSERRRRWLAPLSIAAGVIALAGFGVYGWQALQAQQPVVLASAELEAFPAWPNASGTAQVNQQADGTRVLQLSIDTPPVKDEFTEVWLISSDASQLVSLGVVERSGGSLVIPDGIDLSVFELVDVSAEPYDGDPTHSGDSIVRGELRSS